MTENGRITPRKDIGMKLIYGILSVLLAAFVGMTLGVAQGADKQAGLNKTDIAVNQKDTEKNYEIIIEKINGMSAQQTLLFQNMKDDIDGVQETIKFYHRNP